jgi:multidrug efflux pump subunit AcrB
MKLAEVSIRRPVLATVMMAVLVVFGVSSYFKLGLDMMPDVDMPIVMVTAVYPGADPETIESKVVEKLEEAVSTVNGIKILRSTSMESAGSSSSSSATRTRRSRTSATRSRPRSSTCPRISSRLRSSASTSTRRRS